MNLKSKHKIPEVNMPLKSVSQSLNALALYPTKTKFYYSEKKRKTGNLFREEKKQLQKEKSFWYTKGLIVTWVGVLVV